MSTPNNLTGNAIRKTFIEYFKDKGHNFVPSSSLVPGGDATLLFTNAGMVQFKDVFLGTDKRDYTRAVNSQKCMRVAGKHNDLDDVGRDDTHHTFFEMLGNWSFGDYYKKEAIEWGWELFTEVWGLPKENLYATVFEDEKGEIPSDEEAADYWRQQPGINPEHVLYFGRADNFWEMADTGPCGPCSEVHLDRGPEYCNLAGQPHDCGVNGDCTRYLELWNLVFIQYNRLGPSHLEALPATHVDTGLGFERIVSALQDVDSNYRTDLLWPLIKTTQKLTRHSDEQVEENFTPYRVIADHARAAAFLIADSVIPGNMGRNYVTRMIIRRGYRFGGMIGLNEPFLAKVAATVIDNYGEAYSELAHNRQTILDTITREEEQFQRTLDRATDQLASLLDDLENQCEKMLSGEQAADLYTTYGMPLEITRDIAQERHLDVNQAGFNQAMETHRLASGAGKAMGALGGEDVEIYREIRADLQERGMLDSNGVIHDPYGSLEFEGKLLALIVDGQTTEEAAPGDLVEVLLPETHFYFEAGGQVSDTGTIISPPSLPPRERRGSEGGVRWQILITDLRKPAAGIITHVGEVISGNPKVGDGVTAQIDSRRRVDIMRNHTATHLLHYALDKVLGSHARQAGSLVAPDRLRFDFTHPEAVTPEQIEQVETLVNIKILEDYVLRISYKPLQQAIEEGARALFGEKYEETVRNITITDRHEDTPFSNELCGGTHCENTGEISTFVITSEGSVAAGIRRIEALTGREAYKLIQRRFRVLNHAAATLSTTPEQLLERAEATLADLSEARKKIRELRQRLASVDFTRVLDETTSVSGVDVLTANFKEAEEADADTLRQLADRFRQRYPENGVAVLASVVDERPIVIAAVTEDLVKRGIKAGDLVKFVAKPLRGGGGGRPTLAQAGGKDPSKIDEALASVAGWVEENLK
ncbi:MAG: alanine--tRNA ligase [Anaerolineales bacterium]|nr:alanine--tRNA ligase [Anaerolineales bacterium]